jgi:hypothetical protein
MLPLSSRVVAGSDAARLYWEIDMYHLGGAEEISLSWSIETVHRKVLGNSLFQGHYAERKCRKSTLFRDIDEERHIQRKQLSYHQAETSSVPSYCLGLA